MCEICDQLLNQSLTERVAPNEPASQPASNSIIAAATNSVVADESDSSGSSLFENVTEAAGVSFTASTFGAAWGDFNGDNLPDLWVNNHLLPQYELPRKLYLNQGDGTFEDIASEVLLSESDTLAQLEGDFHGSAWADFDNDGDQDLVQLVGGEAAGVFLPPDSDPNVMFINNVVDGQRVLTESAEALGLAYDSAIGQTPIWLDFNKDGLLDLFHTAEQRPDGLYPTTIFRQTDEGFEDVGSTVLPPELQSQAHQFGTLSDLSGDGTLDLVLPQTNPDPTANLILDTSSTPFTDLTATLVPDPKLFNWDAKDIEAADFNNDLQPDLYIASSIEDSLLINTDQGLVNQSEEAGINSVSNLGAFSVTSGDFDNDMDVDIYVTLGRGGENQPNILYENQGDATFIATPDAGGAPGASTGKDQVATADYDLDGFLDLFVTNGAGLGPPGGPYQLFRNKGNDNNWLEIDLEGVESNRDGIGAQVFVTAGGVTQLREQSGEIHKWSQDHKRLHFGLADNTQVDSVEIRWPSGVVQQLENVEANQLLEVVEADTNTAVTPIRIEAEDYAPGGQGISYSDNAPTNFGKVYRSDGVDIEATTDQGGGFNVGWIRAGEWLTYDLNVPQDGTYDLVARVATPNDDRSLSATIGDQTATLEFDSTGGFQTWQDVVAEVELSAGPQQLRVDMLTDSFNLNYLELIPVGLSINGTDGVDNLDGTDSDDVINGLAGNDTIRSGAGSDTVTGGEGDDFIVSYDWQIRENDDDIVEGNAGNDRLRGGWGKDTIAGGTGNDLIVGGWGNDIITGGEGSDRFLYEVLDHAGDTITDFSPTVDLVNFKGEWFDSELELGVLSAEQFVIGTAAGDENDHFIYDQSSGNLFYDKDGSGGTNQSLIATLSNQAAVSANNIVVV